MSLTKHFLPLDAAASTAKGAKAAGGKSSKALASDPAEQKEEIPKRFVHTSAMGGIAVFNLEVRPRQSSFVFAFGITLAKGMPWKL